MSWDNIKTIAEFDGDVSGNSISSNQDGSGDGTPSTRYADQRNIGELTAGKPTTSTSLLIESLIQLLCLILEEDAKISNESYKAICKQLQKINLIDDSYAMNEFEEMRSQYQMQIYKIICAVRGENLPRTLPTVTTQRTQAVETCWSRYHREFEEVDFIAGGGFGKVFKAKHKLDGIEYAVKQIKIHSTTIKLCHLAEVKTIASLNHPNIVQYKAAWLEPYVSEKNALNMIESDHDGTDYEDDESPSNNSSGSYQSSKKHLDDPSSDFIQFERSHTEAFSNNIDSCNNQIICKYQKNSYEEFRIKPKLAILYIQMSLCQLTLRKWLDDRNAFDNLEEYYRHFFGNQNDVTHLDIVNDIFCQILSGLNYIHSRNIIHHDIKPSNIFLELEKDGKLVVQLGDFGLACPLQNGHRGMALGTPLYAAPEQLNGVCNPKSDIFSLGIVLIEILLKFSTDMERVRTIENARKGILPQKLSKKYSKLLNSLLSHDTVRPNTKELMEAIRVINLEQNLRALQASQIDIQTKDARIKSLLQKIASLHDNNEQFSCSVQNLNNILEEKVKRIEELEKSLLEKDEEIKRLKLELKDFRVNNISS